MSSLAITEALLGAGIALALAGASVGVVAVLVGLAVLIELFLFAGDLAGWGG